MIARADNDDDQLKRLDFSGFAFPSDSLSISTLRKAHPGLFDKGFSDGGDAQPLFFLAPGVETDNVGSMLYCEREAAAHAYANARGIPRPESDINEIYEELAEHYARYGIASGRHQATELIRGIELQAVQLAEQKRR